MAADSALGAAADAGVSVTACAGVSVEESTGAVACSGGEFGRDAQAVAATSAKAGGIRKTSMTAVELNLPENPEVSEHVPEDDEDDDRAEATTAELLGSVTRRNTAK